MKLIPPVINHETMVCKIVCTRPTRKGCFTIPHTMEEGKFALHCTGHGGAGWTTLFGYVDKAISLIPKGEKIHILGSGCMGLLAAIELKRRGYDVAGITTESLQDNASWKAAGYFALIKMEATPEEQQNAYDMGIKTFMTYREIEQGKHPYLKAECVRFLPVYCCEEMVTGVEKLASMHLIPEPREVTLDFNGVKHDHYLEYMTYFMSTSKIMKALLVEIKKHQIPINIRKINSFSEIKEKVVFNCTGMGSKELCHDELMVGVRGHLIMLDDPSNHQHTQYMIYTIAQGETLYMFPKDYFVSPEHIEGRKSTATLGGTFIPYADELPLEEQKKLDEREFAKMIARHQRFFYGSER